MCIVHLLVLKNQVTLQYVLQVPVNVVAWSFVLDAALPQENSSWLYKARSARGATLIFESVAFEPPRAQELRPGKYQSSRNYSLTHYSFRVITKKKEFSKLSDWGKFTKLWDLQRTKLDRSDMAL